METGTQQPQSGTLANIATPTFAGTPVPGVPQAQQPDQRSAEMLQWLKQLAQRKQMQNTAVPMSIPQGGNAQAAQQIGMNTAWPSAWGKQRLLASIAANIKTGVAKQKENQLLKAEEDWSYLQSSLNELYAAQQSGDQNAIKAAQAKVDVTLQDPKKLKNMAKALNQDWLNPEKTTVYWEALKRVAAKQGQADQQNAQKQQAGQNLKQMFMKLLGQKQQLQMTLDEKERMAREIEAKAPTTTTGPDKETVMALRDQMKAEEKASEDEKKETARQKEEAQKEEWRREDVQMTQKYQAQQKQLDNNFRERMESMKEVAAGDRENKRDLAMLEATNLKLTAAQEKLFKTDPSKIEKEVNDSVTTFRQQLSQAEQNLRSLKSQASNHWITGPGKDDIKDAQDQVDAYKKALAHIEKNRDAIVKGKADFTDVINKAESIMGGEEDQPPAPPVPGAVVKQVQ